MKLALDELLTVLEREASAMRKRLEADAERRARNAATRTLGAVQARAREWARNPTYSAEQREVLRDFASFAMADLGLALEQGTPATREETP